MIMTKLTTSLLTIALAGLLLSGCSGTSNTREMLGLSRNVPDEMRVVSNPPLTVPPEFRLAKPQPGALPRGRTSADSRAEQLVLGSSAAAQAAPISSGSSLLLQKAGANAADPSIRTQLNEESRQLRVVREEASGGFLGTFGLGDTADEPIVRAAEEKDRLQQAVRNGEPVAGSADTTTEIEKKDGESRHLLDSLF